MDLLVVVASQEARWNHRTHVRIRWLHNRDPCFRIRHRGAIVVPDVSQHNRHWNCMACAVLKYEDRVLSERQLPRRSSRRSRRPLALQRRCLPKVRCALIHLVEVRNKRRQRQVQRLAVVLEVAQPPQLLGPRAVMCMQRPAVVRSIIVAIVQADDCLERVVRVPVQLHHCSHSIVRSLV